MPHPQRSDYLGGSRKRRARRQWSQSQRGCWHADAGEHLTAVVVVAVAAVGRASAERAEARGRIAQIWAMTDRSALAADRSDAELGAIAGGDKQDCYIHSSYGCGRNGSGTQCVHAKYREYP